MPLHDISSELAFPVFGPTAVKTSGYTAAPGDLVPCDISGGGFTVTLPTAPPDGTQVCVEVVKRVTSGVPTYVTAATGGSDVLFIASGATSGIIGVGSVIFQYKASSGIWYAPGRGDLLPVGWEFGYAQITSAVPVLSTTEASGTTIIAPGALTFDGAPVLAEFWCEWIDVPQNALGDFVMVCLFEGSTQITRLAIAWTFSTTASRSESISGRYRFAPSAGPHTYTFKAFATSTTGTPEIRAGAAGTGGEAPAFGRFTKA